MYSWNLNPRTTEQGTAEFYRSIHDKQYLETLRLYGAFFKDDLVGITHALRREPYRIVFCGWRYRTWIGRKLFALAAADNFSGRMTVNASPYAVSIYRHLGFTDTDSEQIAHGIRYTPMESHILG
ncbi:MAG: GNAT family N-acetyltransferase [Blautia marasmi]